MLCRHPSHPGSTRGCRRWCGAYTPTGVLLEASPVVGGTSATLTKLRVHTGGCDTLLVLRQPGAAAFEFRLLTVLHDRRLPVPRPVWLEAPGPLLESGGLLLPWVPGGPDLRGSDIEPGVAHAARVLARIHREIWRHPDFSFLPASPPDAPEPSGGHDLVGLHGDYWPGNWLWHDGQLQAVLDWEDAHWGDPLEDLANTRLEVWIRFGAAAAAAFTAAYRAADPHVDTAPLTAYDAWPADRAAGRVVRWTEDPVERGRMTGAIHAFVQATQHIQPE